MAEQKAFTQDALNDVPDEDILAAVPNRPVSSVRDIQMIYGGLYDLATATDEEYGPYLTPMSAAALADTGNDSLVIVDVDVTEPEPSIEAVTAKRLSKEEIPKLGLSYYASRGAGLDHSITHRTGQDVDKEKIARYAMERLTRWTDEAAVRAYAKAELPDDNVLDRLHGFAEHDDDIPDPDYPDLTGGLADISGLSASKIENLREAGLGHTRDAKEASKDELTAVGGIGDSTAETIIETVAEMEFNDEDHKDEDEDVPSFHDESIVRQLEALRLEVHREVSGTTPAIITVRLRTEPGGGFRWPVEVPELMGAMYAQYRSKLSTKNMTDSEKETPAVGEGVDYITNEPAELVGMPEDPLAYFTAKQREKYAGLDITEAWRLHQLSFENAARLSKSKDFIDDCGHRVVSSVVYYLPYYPGEPNAEDLRGLYQILHGLVGDGDDTNESALIRAYKDAEERGDEEDLRFYVTITNQSNNNRYDVFGETVAETALWPAELASAHRAILTSPHFGSGGEAFNVSSVYDSEEEAEEQRKSLALLDTDLEEIDLTNFVTTGWYLYVTHPEDRPRKDGDFQVSITDRRTQMLRKIIGGEKIAIEPLIEAYTERLLATERKDDGGDPNTLVMAQFAQWCALARADLLMTNSGDDALLNPTEYMTDDNISLDDHGLGSSEDDDALKDEITAELLSDEAIGEGELDDIETDEIDYIELDNTPKDELSGVEEGLLKLEKRSAALEHFIASSPVLRDDPERRGVFLLGALIAQVSNYQQMEDRGSTLVDAYPPSAITPNVAERAHSTTIEKLNAYKRQTDSSSTMYSELSEPLTRAFGRAPPETWETRQVHLQFVYGLGIAYGQTASTGLDAINLETLYDEIDRLRDEHDAEATTGVGIAH